MVSQTINQQPYAFDPDYVTEPGDILQETIDALGITQKELASRTDYSTKHVNQIITGKARITPEAAVRLERVTRVPARFWNNLESQYQDRKARLADTKAKAVDLHKSDENPKKVLIKRSALPARSNPGELIAHRGELQAELFLHDLGTKVTRSPFEVANFLAFFESEQKAYQIVAVEVKAIETPLPAQYPVDAAVLARAALSNIPTMLLVVDVKRNQYGFAWLDEYAKNHEPRRRGTKTQIPLLDAEKHRDEIREYVSATSSAHV